MSTRSPGLPYTAQGLGDRIHLISLAFQVSVTEKNPVTLHLANNHIGGHKQDSFLEILNLFPPGHVNLDFHDYLFASNLAWSNYLNSRLKRPKLIGYRDHPGWLEKQIELDAPNYLRNMTLIAPQCEHKLRFNQDHIVFQWDSTGADRLLPRNVVSEIESAYLKSGSQKLVVGGQADIPELKNCLACAARAISSAKYFVGVDSGFMHLALQVIPVSQIHLYTARNRYWSHHLFRAKDNGAAVNFHGEPITMLQMIFVRFRYDSPRIARLAHKIKKFLRIERYENHD